MFNILLLVTLLAGHPPRERAYPWHLMLGQETKVGTAWTDSGQSFLEVQECDEAAQHYRIAECVRDEQMT